MRHSPLYQTDFVVISGKISVKEAAMTMRENHIGMLIVGSERPDGKWTPVGVLTDRDIVMEVVAMDVPLDKIRVEDIMTPDPIVADSKANVFELIGLMRVNGVKRLPIVDAKGALVGVTSADDLLEFVGLELSGLAKLPSRQRKIEAENRKLRRA